MFKKSEVTSISIVSFAIGCVLGFIISVIKYDLVLKDTDIILVPPSGVPLPIEVKIIFGIGLLVLYVTCLSLMRSNSENEKAKPKPPLM
jgi:hypothetical protein